MPQRAWRKQLLVGLVAVATSVFAAGSQTRAEFLIRLPGGTPLVFDPGTGAWTYSYDATLLTGSALDHSGRIIGVNLGCVLIAYAVNTLVIGSETRSGLLVSAFTLSERVDRTDTATLASHTIADLLTFGYTGQTELTAPVALESSTFRSTATPSPVVSALYVETSQEDKLSAPRGEEIATNTSRSAGPTPSGETLPKPVGIRLV